MVADAACRVEEIDDVSQYILMERDLDIDLLPDIALRAVDATDVFVRGVATFYFGDWHECRLVTDADGAGEGPIDDVWDAQVRGRPVADVPLIRLLKVAVESRVRFVIWSGSDSLDLPVADDWREVLDQMTKQTKLQPADAYLNFVPPECQ